MSHPRKTYLILFAFLVASVLTSSASWAAEKWKEFYPDEANPFVGNYEGRWGGDVTVDPTVAVQVIALGKDRYRIRMTAKLDMRAPVKMVTEAKSKGKSLKFESGGLVGEIRDGRITGGHSDDDGRFEMTKVERPSPTLGAAAPAGAIVLFDGSNFDAWQKPEGWELLDGGVMMVTPKGKEIVSKQTFTDAKLHIEFRNSFMPKARGQQRSNSGVFLQDVYEVQVLDSFGLEGMYDECGALYKVAAPRVNACRPPLQWQTYDITYTAAKFDASGKLVANPRMTVYHNGVLIHNDQEVREITAWTEKERLAPHKSQPGHIRMQAHNNYVQYRNVWVVDLSE